MRTLNYQHRRSVRIENDRIRVTVTIEGGHIAEILHKPSGVNPLWTPPWPSIEPSSFDRARHPEYGPGDDARLLSGILGHNVCLDVFGEPGREEAAAGIPVHGEAAVCLYDVSGGSDWIELVTILPKAQLRLERRISLRPDAMLVHFSESVENLTATDRPIAWTQHVTLGPPFLERGQTQFRASATRSKVIGASFNGNQGAQAPDAEFEWPYCPLKTGRTQDLRVFPNEPNSAGFTTHLMDPKEKHAWFAAWTPSTRVLLGYVWQRSDFPWLARWEENQLRTQSPWNGKGLACGMEFGVSPFVESRRAMVDRGALFGVPSFRWIPARTRVTADYCALLTISDLIPDQIIWDGSDGIALRTTA